MRIGIMQPYFFPYLGYFQLIKKSDRFILFDDVQYIRHGWINRNRILKPGQGWQYIVVPLQKHSQTDLIRDIASLDNNEWKQKIIRQLDHYRKKARHYEVTIDLVNRCLDTPETNLVKLNARALKLTCDLLQLPFREEISSEMNFDYSHVHDPGEWALRICEQLGANEYINPPGGRELFDPVKFSNAGIKLSFLEPVLPVYNQKQEGFEAGLSIIDVLMFNGPEATREMVHNFESKSEKS